MRFMSMCEGDVNRQYMHLASIIVNGEVLHRCTIFSTRKWCSHSHPQVNNGLIANAKYAVMYDQKRLSCKDYL